VQDGTRPQVFTFDVESTDASGTPRFYVSTKEGLLWGGEFDSDRLRVLWHQPVDPGLGAALALGPSHLAAVSYNLRVFDLP
jgi:hypothetical protein